MKTTRLILIQLLFLILMSIATQFLSEYQFIKQVCYFILITVVTYFIYKYFAKSEYLPKSYLFNLFTLFLLFELKKYIEYSFGLISPKYNEIVFISMLLSFICIAVYLGGIVLVGYLIKIRFKKKG
jgi:hypothetical protein